MAALFGSAELLVGLIVTILCRQCAAKYPHDCATSSCGKIHNISYPFRLKGDPAICGDPRYELECDNNVTVLYLFSGKYHVQDIGYNMYKIRVTDAGVEEANCSSIPRYFLHRHNFTEIVLDSSSNDPRRYSFSIMEDIIPDPRIAYYECSNPVRDDPRYVDTAGCVDQGVSGAHVYAVLDSNLNFSARDVRVGCRLKVATLAPPDKVNNSTIISYNEIHSLLVYGFELWWVRVAGDDKCHPYDGWTFNPTTGEIVCLGGPTCLYSYPYLSTRHCGMGMKILAPIRAYLHDILKGLLTRIRYPVSNEYLPLPYSEDAASIGRYVLPSYIVVRILLGYAFLVAVLIYQWRRRHKSVYGHIETFLHDYNLMPIRYSYNEIKKMARGFQDKLGQGGYGSVYRGKLRSGPSVAIKILGKAKTNGEDFISEVSTIGRIHHQNIVRLIGFCVEGSKRALVYEFIPNGSLDKYIFSKERNISLIYEKIYEISLRVACGIVYLHQGWDMQILHFDIKPHNILLNENFIPKVSDFGLAKLYPVDDSIVTLTAAKGTFGYIAPELFYKNIGGVSYKADVYSFGMLLMEMTSRRRNFNQHTEHSSQTYFPFWIYDQLTEEKVIDIEDATDEENNIAKRMFITALWCIQLKPHDRPSMNKVVEMLEGETESLEMPPRPSFYPHETVAEDDKINSSQTISSDFTSISTSYNWETTTDPTPENTP